MILLAIDPGNVRTAWVLYDTKAKELLDKGLESNDTFVGKLSYGGFDYPVDYMAIEYPAPRGQPMYTQLVDAIFWIGRFVQAYGFGWVPIDRKDVKMHLCESTRAKDSNIRAALISRFSASPNLGGGRIPAIGIKKSPGPLFGVKRDIFAALAVAVTYAEMVEENDMQCLE